MVDGINAAWISQSDFSTDHRIVLPSGLERIVHEQAQIGYSEKGIPIKWIGTMQDITQAKLAENKLFNITAEVEERERNRFARDLHDGLGPVLSTVKLYFQWLAEANKDESATIIIEKGNKSIDTAIQTAREVSQGLSLQSLNKSGFALTLLEFTKTINTTKKIDIKFTYNSKNRFNSMLETTLYRITTELINNTLKYAKAKNVEIEFNYSKEKNKITLLYTDNGKGFNVAKVEKTNKGLGLMNIKQRIRIIKGSISIDSERKKGTKVMIEIPLS